MVEAAGRRLDVLVTGRVRRRRGDTVALEVDVPRAHLFDRGATTRMT